MARLTRDALYLGELEGHSPGDSFTPRRIPLREGRELVRLADDTLVVVAAASTKWFESNGSREIELGKVAYFPGMHLWPEPRFPQAFATFEPTSGTFSLYRWAAPSQKPATTTATRALRADNSATATNTTSSIFLPKTLTAPDGLTNSICNLLLDGSYACIKDSTLYTGWPGQPAKRLGQLAPGATIERVLPGDRGDHARVLRSDARLEDYSVTSPPKLLSTLSLPWVPFDVVRLKGAVAVLKLEQDNSTEVRFTLSVIESSGALRWTEPLDSVPVPSLPADFDRELLHCRNLAIHPRKPWLAVSNCQSVTVFDSRTGGILAKLQNVRY